MKHILCTIALCLSASWSQATTFYEYFGTTTKDGKPYYTHSSAQGPTIPYTSDQVKVYHNGILKVTLPLQPHLTLTGSVKLGTVTPNVTSSGGSGGGGGGKNLNGPMGEVTFDEERDGTLMIVTDLYTGLATHFGFRSLTCGRLYYTSFGPLGAWNFASRATYPCPQSNGPIYNPQSGIPGGWFPQYIPKWNDEDH